jgi:acetyl coenzyme A synthetase (ADP forming)-like protein
VLSLSKFFNPEAVAVIGVSRTPGKLGYEIVKNILQSGYKGKVYPVNPIARKILGLRTYPAISEITQSVDLAVIATRANTTPGLVEDCAKKGIKAVVITTGGFSEIGPVGEELESAISRIVEETGIRIVGPNCVGVFDAKTRVDTIFDPPSRLERPSFGSVAIVAQSATIGAGLMDWMAQQGVGVSKFVNYGNRCDVNETDLLEYLSDDVDTKLITMHIEGLKNGRRFLEIARRVSRIKPVIIMKTGRTEYGAKATLSHSAAIAGSDVIYSTAFRQVGLIRVMTVEEMLDVAKVFAYQSMPRGRGVAIVGNSGGAAIAAADACQDFGLVLVQLADETIKSLEGIFPSHYIIGNPIDLTGDVTASSIAQSLAAVLDDRNVESVILLIQWQVPLLESSVIDIIGKIAASHREKPIVLSAIGGAYVAKSSASLEKKTGIPTYPTPERAVRALHALVQRSEFLRKIGRTSS